MKTLTWSRIIILSAAVALPELAMSQPPTTRRTARRTARPTVTITTTEMGPNGRTRVVRRLVSRPRVVVQEFRAPYARSTDLNPSIGPLEGGTTMSGLPGTGGGIRSGGATRGVGVVGSDGKLYRREPGSSYDTGGSFSGTGSGFDPQFRPPVLVPPVSPFARGLNPLNAGAGGGRTAGADANATAGYGVTAPSGTTIGVTVPPR